MMQEREITFGEIRVGDTVRLEDHYHSGTITSAQGVVDQVWADWIRMGNFSLSRIAGDRNKATRKVVLVSRPPQETPIDVSDIRLGMRVRLVVKSLDDYKVEATGYCVCLKAYDADPPSDQNFSIILSYEWSPIQKMGAYCARDILEAYLLEKPAGKGVRS